MAVFRTRSGLKRVKQAKSFQILRSMWGRSKDVCPAPLEANEGTKPAVLAPCKRCWGSRIGHEFQVITFPANYCNDGGRRINNNEQDWPDSLEGFAQRAYVYCEKELRPLGYKLRVAILDYPGGSSLPMAAPSNNLRSPCAMGSHSAAASQETARSKHWGCAARSGSRGMVEDHRARGIWPPERYHSLPSGP
jgi:hypothetical protein